MLLVLLDFGVLYTGQQMPTFRRNLLSPSSGIQYFSQKSWHLPTSLHGTKTQKIIIITITAMKTSCLTNIYVISIAEIYR
jgi:membrane-associated PAP2 superfamily phosphatase